LFPLVPGLPRGRSGPRQDIDRDVMSLVGHGQHLRRVARRALHDATGRTRGNGAIKQSATDAVNDFLHEDRGRRSYRGAMHTIDRAVAIARDLGVAVEAAQELTGGNQNHVVRLRTTDDDLVVRFARDPEHDRDTFDIETWCLRSAAGAGLNTSQFIARGQSEGTSYLVVRYVPGSRPDPGDRAAWRAIGAFTAGLREFPIREAPEELFSRFGRDLDAAWESHLEYNLASLVPEDPLIELGVYPRSRQEQLRETVRFSAERRLPQGVIHGDLSHRNLVRRGNDYTVIDWGAASVGPVMWGDLEHLYCWHRVPDPESPVGDAAWAEVLEGAGLIRADAEPIVQELAVLHSLDVVRWAIDKRPDRLTEISGHSRAVIAAIPI
jgi:Ser/Thr protein kinase RdoA (MazF antagonist)